jgi:hypothetical protein
MCGFTPGEVVAPKGDCYRMKERDLGRVPGAIGTEHCVGSRGSFSAVDREPIFGRR